MDVLLGIIARNSAYCAILIHHKWILSRQLKEPGDHFILISAPIRKEITMKKFIVLMLALIMIMGIAIPAFASQTYTTSIGGVFFRKKASTSSGYYGKLSKGAPVLVYCEVPGTMYVYGKVTSSGYGVAKNTTGYIDKSYLSNYSDSDLVHPTNRAQALGANGTVIKNGASGSIVRNIQYCLYLCGKLSVTDIDGIFGNKTKGAVESYQEDKFGIPPDYSDENWIDGQVGDNTRNALWTQFELQLKAHGARY